MTTRWVLQMAGLAAFLGVLAGGAAPGLAQDGTGEGSGAELAALAEDFTASDWSTVWRARASLLERGAAAIPIWIDLMGRDERVDLTNTADLIYPGADAFYGHGWVVDYDLDWIAVRAGWALEDLTFQDFGFSQGAMGGTAFPVSSPPPRDAEVERALRLAAVERARAWWAAQPPGWTRLEAVVQALESDSPRRQGAALGFLRYPDGSCPGLDAATYGARVLPLVRGLATSADEGVRQQAALLLEGSAYAPWIPQPEHE